MQEKPLIHKPSGTLIIIHPEALDVMLGFRQLEPLSQEAGGLIIGKRRGPHFEVTALTPPQPNDRRSRYQFYRSELGHQDLLIKHWRESGHEDSYLGEWHTHPELRARPSGIDRREWKKLYCSHSVPLLVFIEGIQASYYGLLTEAGLDQLDEVIS